MKNNILIFPAGAENALEINEAIRHSVHVNVIPASSREDYSELMYENDVKRLPYLDDKNFIEKLNQLIEQQNIKFIFPTHDTAALFFTENRDKINCGIISSDNVTNEICRYKLKTYELFKNEDFCPKIFRDEKLQRTDFPIFAKPNVGQGSQGVKLIENNDEYGQFRKDDNLLFVEYLPGREFTVDCFTNKNGELLFIGPRERAQIKMGISFKSVEYELTDEIKSIAHTINEKLNFRGLWFFQIKEDKSDRMKLMEISTRTAGTMGYFRHKNVNLPLFSIYDALDMDIEIKKADYDVTLYRTTINKYKYSFGYSTVYIDYDDTIIVNEKVNKDMMSFLYQCQNKSIDIILISKHAEDIYQSLNRYAISTSLFKEIIELKPEEKKSDFIRDKNSIFIDNWYKERKEVSERCDIFCFDVDIVKSLIIK